MRWALLGRMRKWAVRFVIGLSLLAAPLLALCVWLGNCQRFYEPRQSPEGSAHSSARVLRTAIQQWQAMNKQVSCPAIEQLVADEQLDPGQATLDPWQQPYRTRCTADDVTVSSAGPDRRFGTADDIAVPRETTKD